MAEFILENCRVEINAVNYTVNVKSVSMNFDRDDLDVTAMGDVAHGSRLGLITNEGPTIEAYNDYTDNGMDEALYDLANNRTAVTCKIRENAAAAISTGNPEYQYSAVYVKSITPITGEVGSIAMNSIVLIKAKGCVLTRAVA